MYESSVISLPATTLDFAALTLPEHWNGRQTVQVTDVEGNDACMTVAPGVAPAARRAALLAEHGLCTRIDLGLDDSGLHIVSVYWEG
jgi:hypothetical protein